jgi:hypothetical protein
MENGYNINISGNIELDKADVASINAFIHRLGKKKKAKLEQENATLGKRVYIMRITSDSIMVSGNSELAHVIKGKKEAEYIARQLEKRHGRKFYIEECEKPIKKSNT